MRSQAHACGVPYDIALIVAFCRALPAKDEEVLRILYYDCAPYNGTVKRPISRTDHTFEGSDAWLKQLAAHELFAVRLGILKFRGWKPKARNAGEPPTDEHYSPQFQQKGVDLRIGLDIANFSHGRTVERIILVTGDTDLIPAMKLARRCGLQIVGVELPKFRINQELAAHIDIRRKARLGGADGQ